jgi:hypothetical protein
LAGDAYTAGQAMVALRENGVVDVPAPQYRRACAFCSTRNSKMDPKGERVANAPICLDLCVLRK